jgi:predicted kinase
MNELVILCGLQASGKSSFYRARLQSTHKLVSKDCWPNLKNKERRQLRLVREYLSLGHSVVVDNTNPTRRDRAPLLQIATDLQVPTVCFWFSSSVTDSLFRNAQRSGRERIPEVGVYAKKFEEPQLAEGFTEMYLVTMLEGSVFEIK